MKVDALLSEDGPHGVARVIGIRAGDDEIAADLVIVAEGVLGLLSTAGRTARRNPCAAHHALGFKEVIELSPQVIEDRWHLSPGEGAAQLFIGAATRNMTGGGFLYTNQESISLGLVVGMEQLRDACGRSRELAAPRRVQELPGVRPLARRRDGRSSTPPTASPKAVSPRCPSSTVTATSSWVTPPASP